MDTAAKKPLVVFIDDEERILRVMSKLFRKTHEVFCTTDPAEYLEFIKNNDVHVAVSDQRMPERTGVEILKDVKDMSPNTMRILLTGYADLEAIMDSINEGEIFRYLTKPCKSEEMLRVVGRATEIALSQKQHMGTSATNASAPVLTEANIAPAQTSGEKATVLVLDDDERVMQSMAEEFGDLYKFKWASNLDEAYHYLDSGDISVCVSDIHVDGDNIAPAIYTLKQHAKDIVVLIQTSFRDAGQLIDLINKGQVYRCLPKPLRLNLTRISLERAYQHHLQLVNVPEMLDRHEVEESDVSDNTSLSNQVRGFLQRIRARLSA